MEDEKYLTIKSIFMEMIKTELVGKSKGLTELKNALLNILDIGNKEHNDFISDNNIDLIIANWIEELVSRKIILKDEQSSLKFYYNPQLYNEKQEDIIKNKKDKKKIIIIAISIIGVILVIIFVYIQYDIEKNKSKKNWRFIFLKKKLLKIL